LQGEPATQTMGFGKHQAVTRDDRYRASIGTGDSGGAVAGQGGGALLVEVVKEVFRRRQVPLMEALSGRFTTHHAA
jgi:hypothetical protein